MDKNIIDIFYTAIVIFFISFFIISAAFTTRERYITLNRFYLALYAATIAGAVEALGIMLFNQRYSLDLILIFIILIIISVVVSRLIYDQLFINETDIIKDLISSTEDELHKLRKSLPNIKNQLVKNTIINLIAEKETHINQLKTLISKLSNNK